MDEKSLGGCSAANNNSCTEHTVWSAEWSFGAALMCKTMAKMYQTSDPAKYTELMGEAKSIHENVMLSTQSGGLQNNEAAAPYNDGGLMYGNSRFFIPWGWYANPVSSLCGTAWSIMDEHDFNPFVLGGGEVLVAVPKVPEIAAVSKLAENTPV